MPGCEWNGNVPSSCLGLQIEALEFFFHIAVHKCDISVCTLYVYGKVHYLIFYAKCSKLIWGAILVCYTVLYYFARYKVLIYYFMYMKYMYITFYANSFIFAFQTIFCTWFTVPILRLPIDKLPIQVPTLFIHVEVATLATKWWNSLGIIQ